MPGVAADLVSLRTLVAAYAELSQPEKALGWLNQMECAGFLPDSALCSQVCELSGSGGAGGAECMSRG